MVLKVMFTTQIKGSHIKGRRKILRMTQSDLLIEMASHGRKIGSKTISLWERQETKALQVKNYLVLCACLKIDHVTQQPMCIFEDENVITMCSKIKLFSSDAKKILFDIVDNINEETIGELQTAHTYINSRSRYAV